MGEIWTQCLTLFSWALKSPRTETALMKFKDTCSWEQNYTKPRQCIRKQRHHFVDKGPYTQSYSFSSSHVWMSELDHKEGWALKNWCFWTVVLEKTHESPLDSKEIKPVTPKGNQLNIHWKDWYWSRSSNILASWCEEPTHWKTHWCWEILKAGGEGDDRGWNGWMKTSNHHWVNGHEFEQTLGDREGQGSLARCSPWGHKEPDMNKQLKSNKQY